ncbi:hypothetical protein YC2023_082855 [Brassica napus]
MEEIINTLQLDLDLDIGHHQGNITDPQGYVSSCSKQLEEKGTSNPKQGPPKT